MLFLIGFIAANYTELLSIDKLSTIFGFIRRDDSSEMIQRGAESSEAKFAREKSESQ